MDNVAKLKIGLYQFNPHLGNLEYNYKKILTFIEQSSKAECSLLLLPELALCGYPPEDLLFRSDFIHRVNHYTNLILSASTNYPALFLALTLPTQDSSSNFYNSCYIIKCGQILAQYNKQKLPNYGVFDEKRYFTQGSKAVVFECHGVKIGLVICEDMWFSDPIMQAKAAGAELICVLNASPYDKSKYQERLIIAKKRVIESNIPLVYVHMVGGQDELVFDGNSFMLNAQANLVVKYPHCIEGIFSLDCQFTNHKLLSTLPSTIYKEEYFLNLKPSSVLYNEYKEISSVEQDIYYALVLALRDYVIKNRFEKVILGLSGGIDSALTLAMACDALGADHVIAVMLPSCYTSSMSIDDSRQMVQTLGVIYYEVEINPITSLIEKSINSKNISLNELSQENIQARARGLILMAISMLCF
jgi:NAD+ synthase (glutamine-hydrolysing)